MSDPYRPIDCGLHDHLEAWAVRRVPCRFRVHDDDGHREFEARIDDLFARDGAEFARLSNGDVVRLDRIEEIRPIPPESATSP